ncbi:MAG: DUF2304 domain-containing protein [Bacteroidia bacterium]|nr:DUF2304 domain-containing protein [Bacteroidia bacterium]
MSLEVYQIVVPIISVVSASLIFREFIKGNNTLFETILWSSIWLGIAAIALFPDPITMFLSKTIGIKDHINAIIFIGLAISFFLHYRLFNYIKKQNRDITDLIRKIAIDNEVREQNRV